MLGLDLLMIPVTKACHLNLPTSATLKVLHKNTKALVHLSSWGEYVHIFLGFVLSMGFFTGGFSSTYISLSTF